MSNRDDPDGNDPSGGVDDGADGDGHGDGDADSDADVAADGRGDADDRAERRDDHLADIDDGCGCAEVWETLSEARAEAASTDEE